MAIFQNLIVKLAAEGLPAVKSVLDAATRSIDAAKRKVDDFQAALNKLRISEAIKIKVDTTDLKKLVDSLEGLKDISIKAGGGAGGAIQTGLAAGGVGLLADAALINQQKQLNETLKKLSTEGKMRWNLAAAEQMLAAQGRPPIDVEALKREMVERMARTNPRQPTGGSPGSFPLLPSNPSFPHFPVPSSGSIHGMSSAQFPPPPSGGFPTTGGLKMFVEMLKGTGLTIREMVEQFKEGFKPPHDLRTAIRFILFDSKLIGQVWGQFAKDTINKAIGGLNNIGSLVGTKVVGGFKALYPLGEKFAGKIGTAAKGFWELAKESVKANAIFGEKWNKSLGELIKGSLIAKASIVGLATYLGSTASPMDFGFMTANLTILARSVGSLLIPVMRELETKIANVTAWFDSLSLGTKEVLAWFAKWTLYVVGGTAALGGMIKVGGFLVGVLRNLWVVGSGVVMFAKGLSDAIFVRLIPAFTALGAIIMAHPLITIATVLTAATAAAVGFQFAFSKIGMEIGAANAKIQELEALLGKMREGGVPNAKELRNVLSEEDYKRLVHAENNPEQQKKILEEIKAREMERGKLFQDVEKRATSIQERAGMDVSVLKDELPNFFSLDPYGKELQALLRERGIDTNLTSIGGFRFGKIRGGLEETGMSHGEATRLAADIMAELYKQSVIFTGNARILGPEKAKETGDIFRRMAKENETVLEAIKRGIEATGFKFEDKFTPRMLAQQPQLMPVVDAWRKAQMAVQGDTPDLRLKQDMLRRMIRAVDYLDSIDKNTRRPRNLQ